MNVEFLSTVRLASLRPQTVVALGVVGEVYRETAQPMSGDPNLMNRAVITSGSDGEHSRNSAHYDGRAFDVRIRNLFPGQPEEERLRKLKALVAEIRRRLPPGDFDVILESDHIHVEFQPHIAL